MLIIHHTLHNNRKKPLIVRHTPENRDFAVHAQPAMKQTLLFPEFAAIIF